MKFIAENNQLTIKLEGIEVFWGLRRKIVIPRRKIASLAWTPQFSYTGKSIWRFGGTGAPRLLYAGNFRSGGDWYFLYISRPKGSTSSGQLAAENILDINATDFRYRRILLSCQPDIAASLMNWWTLQKNRSS
ncbi:MAG: hypothetical protein ABI220_02460 [Candidatus Saccharimonadales bacterium]